MGLDIRTAEFLLHSRNLGVDFSNVATLGHQRVMLSPTEEKRVSSWLGGIDASKQVYADFFLKALGAVDLHSIDASAYEGAEILHNLNAALPPELHSRFSCLIDGGTLEHIFDFKEALKSCMQMVRPGGHLIICQMANNCMGHGFYQFSPELFYSALTPENGYQLRFMALNEKGIWYEPLSPQKAQERIQAQTTGETFIYVVAQRISEVAPFVTPPHQSDYVSNLSQSATELSSMAAGAAAANRQSSLAWLKALRRRAGTVKRNYVYRALPWLGELEDRYNRFSYLRADSLNNQRRFRLIGKRLPLALIGLLPQILEVIEAGSMFSGITLMM